MLVQVNHIVLVKAGHRQVGGYNHNIKAVNFVELYGLGVGSTSHAGYFFVESEIILKGNSCQSTVTLGYLDPLLGFDSLMETV